MKKRTDQYLAEIKDGDPPERVQTHYPTKMFEGALNDIARRIRPGQYVEDLSAGSMGKLAGLIKERGLTVIFRQRSGESRGNLYVVTDEWVAKHPERR